MFQIAGPVIVYGVSASVVYGFIYAPKIIKQAVDEMIDTLRDVQTHHKRFGKVLAYEIEDAPGVE